MSHQRVKGVNKPGTSQFQNFRRELRKKAEKQSTTDVTEDDDQERIIHPRILKNARQSGILNLDGRMLEKVPDIVWKINEPEDSKRSRVFIMDKAEEMENWWEGVDLSKLILSSNRLTELSEKVGNLLSLQYLDLHDNELKFLPSEIGILTRLQKLNLNRNGLRSLPNEIENLTELRSLSASHNDLTEIPDGISKLLLLNDLNVSHNRLSSLPNHLGYLSKITDLDVSHNEIQSIPEEMSFMTSLKYLEVSYNRIETLDGSILTDISGLQRIFLQHNRLFEFPSLSNPQLKELHLSYNQIRNIPTTNLESLIHLTILDLKENRVESIPDEISVLRSLERLDVSNNHITNVPSTLSTMPQLKSLSLLGNPIKTIRRDILNRGTQEFLKYLQTRRLNQDDTKTENIDERSLDSTSSCTEPNVTDSSLTKGITLADKYSMKRSSKVNLSGKSLTESDVEIVDSIIEAASEVGVTIADLSKNNFSNIPSRLSELTSGLTELNLSQNKIESVPEWLNIEGGNLQFIDLANNKLTDFRFRSSVLRELNLCYNRLRFIPDDLYECTNLEVLLIRGNKIETLLVSNGLENLSKLSTLDISNNDLRAVPPELGRLTHITHLQIEGNAFRVPGAQVLAKGTASIMAYLRNRLPS